MGNSMYWYLKKNDKDKEELDIDIPYGATEFIQVLYGNVVYDFPQLEPIFEYRSHTMEDSPHYISLEKLIESMENEEFYEIRKKHLESCCYAQKGDYEEVIKLFKELIKFGEANKLMIGLITDY